MKSLKHKRFGLVGRFVILFAVATSFSVIVCNFMVFINQTGLIVENVRQTAVAQALELKSFIESTADFDSVCSAESISPILDRIDHTTMPEITISRENGEVISERIDDTFTSRTHLSLDEMKENNTAFTRFSFEKKLFHCKLDRKNNKIDIHVPLRVSRHELGIALFRAKLTDIDAAMSGLYRQSIIISLLIIGIFSIVAFVMYRAVIHPLRTLNTATRKIASGHLEQVVVIGNNDEFSDLAASFNSMAVSLRKMHEDALGANPLTGLPGNVVIARTIDTCLQQNRKIAVCYIDLDNFKAYNDKYGFSRGDDAIRHACDSIKASALDFKEYYTFIGHEGGDDFVVICALEIWEPFAKAFLTHFQTGVAALYDSEDSARGCIISKNRKGETMEFPLLSVSVAIVGNGLRVFSDHKEMIHVAAEMKKFAKSKPGSKYVFDRRTTDRMHDSAEVDSSTYPGA